MRYTFQMFQWVFQVSTKISKIRKKIFYQSAAKRVDPDTNQYWLVVSTHLKNMSQIGWFPQVGVKIKKHLKPPPSKSKIHPSCCSFRRHPLKTYRLLLLEQANTLALPPNLSRFGGVSGLQELQQQHQPHKKTQQIHPTKKTATKTQPKKNHIKKIVGWLFSDDDVTMASSSSWFGYSIPAC